MVLVALSLGPSSPARAGGPPEVSLVTRTTSARASLATYCWSEYDPPFVYTECNQGDVAGPPSRRLSGLRSVHMRIDHPQEPDAVELVYWRGTDRYRPANPRGLPVTMRRIIDTAGPAWAADFRLPAKWKQISLEIKVSWQTEMSCPTCGRQWARWRVTLVR